MRFLSSLFRLVPFSTVFQYTSPSVSILSRVEFVSGLLLTNLNELESGLSATLSDSHAELFLVHLVPEQNYTLLLCPQVHPATHVRRNMVPRGSVDSRTRAGEEI